MSDPGNANQPTAKLFSMKPNSLGRRLGVGVRVGANILRDRAGRASQATASSVKQEAPVYAARGKAVGRGAKAFGRAFWGPFAHVSGVLWLEITGMFFGIFTLFFAQNAWKLHQAANSDQRTKFLLYVAVTLIFAWFTGSSFYRARRKDRKQKPAS